LLDKLLELLDRLGNHEVVQLPVQFGQLAITLILFTTGNLNLVERLDRRRQHERPLLLRLGNHSGVLTQTVTRLLRSINLPQRHNLTVDGNLAFIVITVATDCSRQFLRTEDNRRVQSSLTFDIGNAVGNQSPSGDTQIVHEACCGQLLDHAVAQGRQLLQLVGFVNDDVVEPNGLDKLQVETRFNGCATEHDRHTVITQELHTDNHDRVDRCITDQAHQLVVPEPLQDSTVHGN